MKGLKIEFHPFRWNWGLCVRLPKLIGKNRPQTHIFAVGPLYVGWIKPK
jgi:hypothetical protein